MKRLIALLQLCLIILLAGCTANNPTEYKEPQNKPQTQAPLQEEKPAADKNDTLNEKSPTRVGNLDLGMTLKQVNTLLTDKYTEQKITHETYFGQEYYDRHYETGIDLVVSEAKGVMQFSIKNPEYATELGVKVGDDAQEALAKYRARYQEWVGNQSPEKLIGWFEVQPGVLLILDYEKDAAKFNPEVKKGAKITSITSGYTKYFD